MESELHIIFRPDAAEMNTKTRTFAGKCKATMREDTKLGLNGGGFYENK